MADFRLDGSEIPNVTTISVVKDVKSGTAASIDEGDLFREDDGNPGYVKKGADSDTDSLTKNRVYLCIKQSDETAGADGTVQGVWCPSMRLRGTVTTPGNLVQAVIDTRVTLDVDAGTQKIDEDDTTNGFMRIVRPEGGVGNFDTSDGFETLVIVNEHEN